MNMYHAIVDDLPMLLAPVDGIVVFDRRRKRVSGFLIGRCSSNDGHLFAI